MCQLHMKSLVIQTKGENTINVERSVLTSQKEEAVEDSLISLACLVEVSVNSKSKLDQVWLSK